MPASSIKYIKNEDLDKAKWDACIDNADNGLVYAYSAYLDFMASHWDALVLNDYEAVMPLTWRKKYGFYYLYQPFLAALLGVFGKGITDKNVAAFFKAVPTKFRYWDIYLNHGNFFPIPSFDLYERTNYVLDLKLNYTQIYDKFRDNVKRNIKKAFKLGCSVVSNFPVDEVISLAIQQMHSFADVDKQEFERFKMLYLHFHNLGRAITYGILNIKGELIASCVFLYSHNRAYYILVGNHPDGKTLGAGHALINEFIKDHAGQPIWLDFEGSDIHNIAFFYTGFGAIPEKYPGIKYNKLPVIVRWLKE